LLSSSFFCLFRIGQTNQSSCRMFCWRVGRSRQGGVRLWIRPAMGEAGALSLPVSRDGGTGSVGRWAVASGAPRASVALQGHPTAGEPDGEPEREVAGRSTGIRRFGVGFEMLVGVRRSRPSRLGWLWEPLGTRDVGKRGGGPLVGPWLGQENSGCSFVEGAPPAWLP